MPCSLPSKSRCQRQCHARNDDFCCLLLDLVPGGSWFQPRCMEQSGKAHQGHRSQKPLCLCVYWTSLPAQVNCQRPQCLCVYWTSLPAQVNCQKPLSMCVLDLSTCPRKLSKTPVSMYTCLPTQVSCQELLCLCVSV